MSGAERPPPAGEHAEGAHPEGPPVDAPPGSLAELGRLVAETGAEYHARRGMTSHTLSTLPPSGIRRFFELLDGADGVISLAVGQPDFPTPSQITRAAADAMLAGHTGYTSNYGLLELREALAGHLDRRYGVDYSPTSELLLTTGVSEALDVSMRALLDHGDEVLVPEPGYVAYQPVVMMAGGVYVPVPTTPEQRFMVTAEALEARVTPATKAILLAYPSNPTGAVMTPEALEGVAAVAREHDLFVISDELYDRLLYGVEHVCFAALPGMRDRTVLLGGFSKAYAMTGWRLGYVAARPDLLEAIMKIHQYVMMSAPTAAQYAALEAFHSAEEDVRGMVAEYDRRRVLVCRRIAEIGLPLVEPRGAFYAFPDVRPTGMDGQAFAEALLAEEQVAVVPGGAFGESGRDFVRICYATAYDQLAEALDRIERFVRRRVPAAGVPPADRARAAKA